MDCLVLNAAWEPVARVELRRAVRLWLKQKAEVIESYEDRRIGVNEWKVPSVVRLVKAIRRNPRQVKFSRENVYARDGGCCQYCSRKVRRDDFTYDHVIPRSQGGQTSWTNVAVSCPPCNQRKGGRTPEQAGMKLRSVPRKPKAHELPERLLYRIEWRPGMPDTWRAYMRDTTYWKGEMQSDEKAA